MKYIVDIRIDEISKPTVSIIDCFDNICEISLTVPPQTKIENVLNKKCIVKLLRDEYEMLKGVQDPFLDRLDVIKRIVKSENEVLDSCLYITASANESTKQYFEQNPVLKKQNIHFTGSFPIDVEIGNKLKKLFGDYDNVSLYIDGNNTPRTIEEYLQTINGINNIVSEIEKYDLSELEKIMYAYDLVRDRVYTRESDKESKSVSRDLSSVLFGDKIVCAGYVAIFNAVLKGLGINAIDYILYKKDNSKTGHVRSMVQVKDDKYNVNGVFLFDPTWDSKKNSNDKNYLTSYKFFCKTKDELSYFDQAYIPKTFASYNKNFYSKIKKEINEEGIEGVSEEDARTINKIAFFIDGHQLVNNLAFSKAVPQNFKEHFINTTDINKMMSSLKRYQKIFYGQTLDPLKLLEIIYNVRKIEYYENPEKYPFDIESIKKAVIGATLVESKLLHILYGLPEKLTEEEFDEWKEENDLERNIEGVILTRKLKTDLENRSL